MQAITSAGSNAALYQLMLMFIRSLKQESRAEWSLQIPAARHEIASAFWQVAASVGVGFCENPISLLNRIGSMLAVTVRSETDVAQ